MVHTSCAVSGCHSSSRLNQGLRFHQFPHNQERCQIWIKACNRPDLEEKIKKNDTICKHLYLCSLHFEKKMYAKFSLRKMSVPTLLLPGSMLAPEITETAEMAKNLTENMQTDQSEANVTLKRTNDSPTDADLTAKNAKTGDEDEFDLFCRSLALQLKRMPLDRALRCQEKLQAIMSKERLSQLYDLSSSSSPTPSSYSEISIPVIDYIKVEDEQFT